MNYACVFSQSESGKYFEWIIVTFNLSTIDDHSKSEVLEIYEREKCRLIPHCEFFSKWSRDISRDLLTRYFILLKRWVYYVWKILIQVHNLCRSYSQLDESFSKSKNKPLRPGLVIHQMTLKESKENLSLF